MSVKKCTLTIEYTGARWFQICMGRATLNGIDGATFSDGIGVYCGEIEKSLQVDIIDFDGKITPKKIRTISANLCEKLNQNEIITSKTQINIF